MKTIRIFYAADRTPNASSMQSSQLWYKNLYMPLVDLGHDVAPFQYDLTPHFRNLNFAAPKQKAFIEENRPKLEQALLAQIEKMHRIKPFDLFFSYFYSACARPQTIRAIRDMGITTVNWYCNASYQFHLVEEIAPAYDYCLVPEKYRLNDYRRVGANPIYCQEAANPNIYKSYDVPQEFDVTFVGQAYGDRPSYVGDILDAGIDIRVWGPGWDRCIDRRKKLPAGRVGGILSDEELILMYSRSKINLGFSTCGSTHESERRIVQIRLRDFEVPMSGGFYLVEYIEELEEFFEVGKEIVCYEGLDDLVKKIRYYLRHEDERKAIAMAGRRRCLHDHTWHKRFETAFRQMGLG